MALMTTFWLKRMDALADSSPGLYYALCWLLAAFGYASLLLFPVLTLAAPAFLAYIALTTDISAWQLTHWLLAAAVFALGLAAGWLSLTLFRTRLELPHGRELERDDFRVLLDRIGELVTSYRSPPIEHVRLTARFEIDIQRTASNGFPSRFTHTLLIGLPVMSCMSPLHLKLLLARQIGYLAATRGNYRPRLIYLRRVWQSYADYYARDWRAEHIPFRLLFCWFNPLFEVTTRAAVRLSQFDKDRCMLDITTAQNAAEAIAVFAVKKHYLQHEFWPALNNMAFTRAKPAWLPYSSMDSIISQRLDAVSAQLIYEAELNRQPQPGDVYANLGQRLQALGVEDFVAPDKLAETAASHFLGDNLQAVQKQLDNVWYLRNKSVWNLRYKKGLQEKEQLKEMRKQAAQSLLSNDEARQYLLLLEKYVDRKKALPLYAEILQSNALDPGVCYELGRLMLEADEPEGIQALHMAMEQDESYTIDCCQHIVKYMANQGDMKQAQKYRRMILAHQVEH